MSISIDGCRAATLSPAARPPKKMRNSPVAFGTAIDYAVNGLKNHRRGFEPAMGGQGHRA